MLKRLTLLVLTVLAAIWLCSCSTATLYQNPVSNFQTAVNLANDSIRPYLLEVNSLIAKANLYDKLGQGNAWGTEDLNAGIPEHEIQLRLQALSTISSYANALGAVANSKDVAELETAANALSENVNGLNATIQGISAKRSLVAGGSVITKQAASLDLSKPVSSLVKLVGTLVIEHQQKKAIEAAILNGDQSISKIIDLLKTDLRNLTLVDETSYAAIQTGMVQIYQSARGKSDPKGLIALIDQFVQENNRIQTLRALQADSLLSDMGGAHAALVAFAKSSKHPKDLSDLAARIAVFTAHVRLFDDAITSTQSFAKPSK